MVQQHPTLGDMGINRLMPRDNEALPLGGGMWTLPHYLTFVAWMNQATGTYWWTFDEALRDSQVNSDAMRNDLVIRDALSSRYRSVCMLEDQVVPKNKANKSEQFYADKLKEIINEIPYVQQLKRSLLEAIFFGKYGVQPLCKWDYSLGYRRMVVKDWYPVHGDQMVFKWDGTPGILVNPFYRTPTTEFTERGAAHFLTPAQEEIFLWHEFEREDSTYWSPEFAGSVHGSGMRGRIYWYWWLRQNAQKFMMNFMKKAGNGFLLVGYPSGNVAAKNAAKNAVEGQEGNNVIYVPVNNQNGDTLDKVVQHVPTQMSGAEMQWTVVTGLNELIRMAVLGETLTTRGGNTGLGSNLGEQHGMTADERTKYDAVDLETPLNKMLRFLNKKNCPGNPCPRYTLLADKRNPGEVMDAANFALDAGMSIPQSWVEETLGIPSRVGDEPVLARIQPMQATAVGNTPGGTPMVGPSGPAQMWRHVGPTYFLPTYTGYVV
jgi:hypothetical protein